MHKFTIGQAVDLTSTGRFGLPRPAITKFGA